MAIVKTGREGKASGRNVLQEEWERTWSKGRSMGLTISQLPLIARILREDTYHSDPVRQTPHFPFCRCGQEHREVK